MRPVSLPRPRAVWPDSSPPVIKAASMPGKSSPQPWLTSALDQSLSRRANCDDHATAESFWAPLKTACCNNTLPATRAEARSMIFDDSETFYNPVRRHSALGFLSPVAFENQFNNNSLFPVRVFGSTSV